MRLRLLQHRTLRVLPGRNPTGTVKTDNMHPPVPPGTIAPYQASGP